MRVEDIEKAVKDLNKAEKVRLVKYITAELEKEAADDPAQYLELGGEYAIWSPYNEFAAAERLERLLEEQSL